MNLINFTIPIKFNINGRKYMARLKLCSTSIDMKINIFQSHWLLCFLQVPSCHYQMVLQFSPGLEALSIVGMSRVRSLNDPEIPSDAMYAGVPGTPHISQIKYVWPVAWSKTIKNGKFDWTLFIHDAWSPLWRKFSVFEHDPFFYPKGKSPPY